MLLRVVGKLFPGQPKPTPPALPAGPADSDRRRRGATAMEYLAVLSLIFLIILSAVNYFGQETKQSLKNTSDTIQNATKGDQAPPH